MFQQRFSKLVILLLVLALIVLACGGGDKEAPAEPTTEAPAEAKEEPAEEVEATEEAVEATEEIAEEIAEEAPAATEEPAEPAETAPVSGLEPGKYIYSNSNYVRGVTVYDGKIWAATLGGVVAWDAATGEHTKYTTLDGLSYNGVFAITVCPMPEPTLIVGTGTGLNTYDPAADGWKFVEGVFETVPGSSFLSYGTENEVSVLVCDEANGRLLMNYNAVSVLDLGTGNLAKQYKSGDDGLPWSGVSNLYAAGTDIWVASGYRWLSVISGDSIAPYGEENEKLPDGTTVYSVAVDPNGVAWLGTSGGLMRFENGAVTKVYEESVEGLRSSSLYEMAFGPDGTLWLGFINQLCQFDTATETCVSVHKVSDDPEMAGGYISSIYFDEAGNLYYTTDEGFSMFDGSAWHLFWLDEPIGSNFVEAVGEDKDGNVWVCAGTGGITRFSPDGSQWQVFDSSNSELEWGTCDDMVLAPDGTLWLLQGSNLVSYDGTTFTTLTEENGMPGGRSESITVDEVGRVWFGGYDGVAFWDGSAFTVFGADEGWPADDVNVDEVLADGEVVWVGTSGGLFRFTDTQFEQVLDKESPGLPGGSIMGLAKDADGTLLLGTNNGLARFDGQTVTPVPEVELSIWDVAARDGIILAGSPSSGKGGVDIFDGDKWEHISIPEGLPHTSVREVFIDGHGTYWVGGGDTGRGGGLFRLVP